MEIRKEGGLRGAGAPDEARLAKINAYARTPLTAEAVYCFRVRLCDDRPRPWASARWRATARAAWP